LRFLVRNCGHISHIVSGQKHDGKTNVGICLELFNYRLVPARLLMEDYGLDPEFFDRSGGGFFHVIGETVDDENFLAV
jgi:hypothetical protein